MKFLFLFTFLFVQCFSFKEFEIPLESDPLTRFDVPNKYFMTSTLKFIKVLLNLVSTPIKNQLAQIYNEVVRKNNLEFTIELKGISRFLEVPEKDLFIYSFIYEIFAYCTSIVAALPNGVVIHGRNLDYDFTQLLNETSYIAVFTKNGKESFRCVMYGGFIGSHTCMKPGKFAISLNQRADDPRGGIEKNLEALREGGALTPWTIRQITRKSGSYDEAISALEKTQLVAPAYFIVSGARKNEGAVITRSRDNTVDTWRISKDEWFLVQVNTDRWKPIPPKQIDRRTPAILRMKDIGQVNLTMERMMREILTQKPNNQRITLFCAVMCPQNGTFNIEVQKAESARV